MRVFISFLSLTLLLIPLLVSATHDVTIVFPTSESWVNETIQVLHNETGTSPDCFFSANGGVYNPIPCNTPIDFDTAQCPDGEDICIIEIIAMDHGENVSESVTFSVDNSPPTITFVSLNTSVAGEGDEIDITSDGHDPHGMMSCVGRFAYENETTYQPGGNLGSLGNDCNQSKTLPETIPEGSYLIRVVPKNKVGATASASVGITIDNTPPTANITSPLQGAVLVNTTTIRGTADDDHFRDYNLEFCRGSACSDIVTGNEPVSGGILATWDTRTTGNGNVTFVLTVTDLAGHSQSSSVDVQINNTVETITPHNFSGIVSVGGVRLSNGSVLKAKINGVEFARTNIINGQYGKESAFSIPGDNLSTQRKEGGVNGDTIEFFVDGTRANEQALFSSGSSTELNLTIATTDTITVMKTSVNRIITISGNDTVDMYIEIKTNREVTDTIITLSKFSKNFLGDISDHSFLKSISIEMDESIIEYVIMKVLYTDSEPGAQSLHENNLHLFRYNETVSSWESLSITRDNNRNVVTANLTDTSMFTLTGTQTCSDGIENQDEEGVDCGGSCSACTVDSGNECDEDWSCTSWSECSGNTKTRDCIDLNECGTTHDQPDESRSCEETICDDGDKECSGNNVIECRDDSEWVVIESCDFGCSDGRCLEESPGNISLPFETDMNRTHTEPLEVTGLFTAENTPLLVGVVVIIIILIVVAMVASRQQKPVYQTFRYTYRPR